MFKSTTLLSLLIFLGTCLCAQEKPDAKFGKISIADFNLSTSKVDTSTAAIVISDIGECHFESVGLQFKVHFTHYKRIRILNKAGFNAANITIPYNDKGTGGQHVYDIKANTYNLENGKIITTKLDGKSIFTENYTKDILLKKFTFPDVKEGSIIEFSFAIESGVLLQLYPWQFQEEYPCMWSEYSVSIPKAYNYLTLKQGYNPFYIDDETYENEFGFVVQKHHWVMKDVDPLKRENFTTTIDNYVAKVEFQLSYVTNLSTNITQDVLPGWPKLSESLMGFESFGADLNKNNRWLDEDLQKIVQRSDSKLEKAKKIYSFVRDNFKCTLQQGNGLTTSLKTIFENRSGNVAEINLLLAAMLNHEEIQSDPVILSTRNHGFANMVYPVISKFNYVVCAASIDSKVYFLDASEKFLSFNHLPEYCYNGELRIIQKGNTTPVYLVADSLAEKKMTSVFIVNDDKSPHDISGSFQCQYGFYQSNTIRKKVSEKKQDDFIKDVKNSFENEIDIQNIGIDSLTQLDDPVTLHYDFAFKNATNSDIIYFSPIIGERYKENPLKSSERRYPVEMPYTSDEVYILDMEIPSGYIVDEMPKSEKITLNDKDGFFEYMIGKSDSNIQLRWRMKLNKATFEPAEYPNLRDFFARAIKLENEQIVFKKKK